MAAAGARGKGIRSEERTPGTAAPTQPFPSEINLRPAGPFPPPAAPGLRPRGPLVTLGPDRAAHCPAPRPRHPARAPPALSPAPRRMPQGRAGTAPLIPAARVPAQRAVHTVRPRAAAPCRCGCPGVLPTGPPAPPGGLQLPLAVLEVQFQPSGGWFSS